MASLFIKSSFIRSSIVSCKSLLGSTFTGQFNTTNTLHSIIGPNCGTRLSVQPTAWSLTSIRTNIRNNWPRPSEKKRLNMNFWNRMKTRGGRAILMRRYLKGRHVLSH